MRPLALLFALSLGCKAPATGDDSPADDSAPACDPLTWYPDADRDGFGVDALSVQACEAPTGHVADGGDCDDADAKAHPGAEEVCTEPGDFNCDGLESYADADQDGYPACAECDDDSAAANPQASEICDGLDNNCDGLTDEDDPTVWLGSGTLFCPDDDGDGHGDITRAQYACQAPAGFVSACDDCDDTHAEMSPGGTELCDGLDNDCDFMADEDC